MQIIRRGVSVAASAREGSIASSSGNARDTPEPLRNVLRWILVIVSLPSEQVAGDDRMDQRAEPVIRGLRLRQDRVDRRTIRRPDRLAGGVGRQLFGDAAGDLL